MTKDSIAERLKALKEGREGFAQVPLNGHESARTRRKLPGFDGRGERVREIVGRVRGITAFEAAGSPFENLIFTGALVAKGDSAEIGLMRAEVGFKFRHDVEMAQISTLGAKDFGSVGGGGSKSMLADVKIYAMQSVGRLRDNMSKKRFQLLEHMIINDVWVWQRQERRRPKDEAERKAAKRRAEAHRRMVLDEVLCALDTAAVHYDLLRYPDLLERWPRARYGRENRREVSTKPA